MWRNMLSEFGTSREYNEPLLYCSRDSRYKAPFGAVSNRATVHLVFPVREDYNPSEVYFYLRRNDHVDKYVMKRTMVGHGYVNFELDFCPHREATYFYRFEIKHLDGGISYVGRGKEGRAIIGEWLPEWQLSVYADGYVTPDAFKGGVVYHIFVDRFNKVGEEVQPRFGVLKKWGEDVTVVDPDGIFRANDFFGGNFRGIAEKLDFLSDLGVTTLYLSPIFESSSNHRYDTGDYMKVDPLLGSEEDFAELINRAKDKGISIILDGVFNHTGADSRYFNKFGHYDSVGAYQSKQSEYYDWFTFDDFPDEYRCWWGITVVPTISRGATAYHNLITGKGGVIEKWTSMGVAGWRLDVVDELSEMFVKKIRYRVKRSNENAVLIGEVWEDASTKYSYGEEREYFRGEDLDGVMNYVFKKAILAFLMGESGEEFAEKTMQIIENYPKQSLDTCMTLIDSHDTVRAINYLSGAYGGETKEERRAYVLTDEEYAIGKKKLMLASALQFFLPGVPSIYYGDEIGMQGFEDPINRRPYTWDNMDADILSHYRILGKYRKERRELFLQPVTVVGKGNKVAIVRDNIILTVDKDNYSYKVEFR